MCFTQTASLLSLGTRCTFVVRSLLIISSRDCREADSRDTSPRHACLGEVSRKIWLHDFAINNNRGSVPVIFISLSSTDTTYLELICVNAIVDREFLSSDWLARSDDVENVGSMVLVT